ncbi:hypothetical protein TYRP_000731 [Tyrophagus putrescentiae]|nr:hypothetical protein TYRP_000731 [Tyrophagus putrescentiae]
MKLRFNEKKTQAMLCTTRRKIPEMIFMMNGRTLMIVKEIRYLGVTIDWKLNWRKHLQEVQKKVRWSGSTKGRQTARFFPSVPSRMMLEGYVPNFVATQFMTGHGKSELIWKA